MIPIRVVIADDHAVLRAGLRLLIDSQTDMTVVAEAGTFAEASQRVLESKPDVLTLDLTMPGGSASELIADLCRTQPSTRVLVLTMHDDPAFLRASLAAGASGYLTKKAADTDLLNAIRAVYRNRTFIDVDLSSGPLMPALAPEETTLRDERLASLSDRELAVLRLVARGHTNQAIANKLFVSVKTIESYRRRLMIKLNLADRAEIMNFAIQHGLLEGVDP